MGAKLKKNMQNYIVWCIGNAKIEPIRQQCIVVCEFTEANRKRDVDNVESAVKYVLDAMQQAGVLENDNPAHVYAAPTFTEYGDVDRVRVTVLEGEKEELAGVIRRMKYGFKEAEI